MATAAAAWVGRYRFVFGAELRRFWDDRLRAQVPAPDPETLAAALAAIEAEALSAVVEIDAGGEIASSAGGRELYRATLRFDPGGVWFDKPGGVRVALRLDGDELRADEPGKPAMRFTRLPPADR